MDPLWNEVFRHLSNESVKAEYPECPFVVLCVDFGHFYLVTFIIRKRYQVTCRVAFLGLVFQPLSVGWNSYG